MNASTKFLTPFAVELRECIGHSALMSLCESYGGQPLHIPEVAIPDSRLVLSIGWAATKRLCAEYGPGRIYVPMLSAMQREMRNRAMRRDGDIGQSAEQLARAHKISARHAHRILAKRV